MEYIVFGAGHIGKRALEFYGSENIGFIVDNDAGKWGNRNPDGKLICSPSRLKEQNIQRVIVAAFNGRSDILKQLDGLNISYCIFDEIMIDKLSVISKVVTVLGIADVILCGADENCRIFKNRIIKDYKRNIRISSVDYDDLTTDAKTQMIILVDSYMHAYNYQRVRSLFPDNVIVLDLYARVLESGCKSLLDNPYENRQLYKDENVWIQANKNSVLKTEINECAKLMNQVQPIFSHVEIETINRCNMTCEFCPANKMVDKRTYKVMDETLFKKIIDDLSKINYSGNLSMFSNNEPLLDNRIIEFNKYAKEKLPDVYLYMFTNGTLLTVEKYIKLINVLDELIIDNYNESLELIRPVEQIKKYIGDNEDLIRKTTIVIRNPKEILTSRGGDSPNRRVKVKQDNTSCMAPFQQFIVRPDGKVSLCCNDVLGRYTMGDLNEKSVEEIWYGEEYTKVRENLVKGRDKEPHCQFCDTYLWQWSMEKHNILAKTC